ncbi:hypothetical protein ACFQ2B_11275 [Streptomyces stramineus]
MRIVMGAQNCGFGPAAGLVAVSRLLAGHERIFVGDGVAAAFARRNADAFDAVRDTAGAGPAAIDELLRTSDRVVSVMDAALALRAVVAGRPVVMVDSLLSFWQLTRPLAGIRALCASMPRSSFHAADRHLSSLSAHERVIAAHLLATHSVVQNFPGVGERAAELAGPGGTGPVVHVTGPIIDVDGLRGLPHTARSRAEPEYDLLVNIGGFKNFLLDFDVNNDYLRLLHRWTGDLLRDWPRFPRVLVCGGPFGEHREQDISAAGRHATCRFLPQRACCGRWPALPTTCSLRGSRRSTRRWRSGGCPWRSTSSTTRTSSPCGGSAARSSAGRPSRFADVLPEQRIPEDDVAGTAALVEIARIREDDGLYARFRRTFNERIERYVSLTPAQRRAGVAELRDALGGEPLSSALAEAVVA